MLNVWWSHITLRFKLVRVQCSICFKCIQNFAVPTFKPYFHSLQKKAGCIIGRDYPDRIVVHAEAAKRNIKKMDDLKQALMKQVAKVM